MKLHKYYLEFSYNHQNITAQISNRNRYDALDAVLSINTNSFTGFDSSTAITSELLRYGKADMVFVNNSNNGAFAANNNYALLVLV